MYEDEVPECPSQAMTEVFSTVWFGIFIHDYSAFQSVPGIFELKSMEQLLVVNCGTSLNVF